MSVEDHVVSFSYEVNIEKAYEDVRRLQTLLYRTLALVRRLGLPEDIEQGIIRIQNMISWLNTLRLTLAALEAASGPLGWAMFGVTLATTAVTTGDFLMELAAE